ncbi:Uma2 family endonuclease [Nocardioides nitrophenolicus]|uniref:Uma2 family endonuclease n=1 Tax=Nocardioides nitrophenolicus TaxID=60489 RepID=UPI0019586384|nr:Uma2 family endonuclease [Nocardioides nitrophenolicus]MBM7518911.1 Uma2 family endonuclease [Nocardioides nitrophenolicus]
MTVTIEPTDELRRIPMTWEDFLDHPETGEYYGGCLVVMPTPSKKHQQVLKRLERLIDATLPPGAEALQSLGWSPPGVRELLIPDLTVFRDESDAPFLSGIPLLVVEVLSTNRRDDLVGKVQRYAAWRAPSYWIVDPRDHQVVTMELVDGLYLETGRVTGGRATLRYGDADVALDIDALLA